MTASSNHLSRSQPTVFSAISLSGCLLLSLQLTLVTAAGQNVSATGPVQDAEKVVAGFRVEIEIRDEESGKLLDRHLVLFGAQRIYDFALNKPHHVTVLDPSAGEVTLLSIGKQIKTSITTKDIIAASAEAKKQASQLGHGSQLGLDAKPTKTGDAYSIAFDNNGDQYHYQVTTTAPQTPGQTARFAEFTDWMCRINLLRRMGPPPFARMTLTEAIAGDRLVPQAVKLTCTSSTEKMSFVSQYQYGQGLSAADQRQIEQAEHKIALFRDVQFQSFPR